MFPVWLHTLSIVSLATGFLCTVALSIDVVRHPQEMTVMNVVWPVTALFGSVAVVAAYLRFGVASSAEAMRAAKAAGRKMPSEFQPFAVLVGKGVLHCGAGCMIGDNLAEWLAFAFPVVAVWCGWHWMLDDKRYAVWILDSVFAFALGIVFQYFAIVPMRGLALRQGIVAAIKADAWSRTAWQVGMYGLMASAQLVWFPHVSGHRAAVDTPEFWFAMQMAMVAGFCTAYPINWWLIRRGVKERI